MSTAESLRSGAVLGPGRDRFARARSIARVPAAPTALIGVLLLLLLYAAFDHGAASLAAGARIQAAVAAIAALACGALVWTGTLRFAAPHRAIVAVGLLGAFACWSGVTVAWSVAPDQTWIELNRAITYVIVLALAVAAGASQLRSVEATAKGFLAIALVVALYGVGQKVLPGIHLAGIFNLDQTGIFPRLQEPFGYWNALGLFMALGVPVGLAIAVDRTASKRIRLLSLLSVEVLIVTLTLTESRGGVLALVIGLIVAVTASGARLRSLLWLAIAVVASLPPLVLALKSHNLNTAFTGLGPREKTGAELGGVLVASLLALWLVGARLLAVEARTRISAERAHRIGRLLVAVVALLFVCLVIALAFSSRGLPGSISHAWHSFTATKGTSVYTPNRLLSVDSENRWVWWKEALGAFSDKPITGWGAGSFPVLHLLYRDNALSVTEAHSVPLQFLAETGLIGGLLAIGAYGLLLWDGVRTVRRRLVGTERLLGAALLAGAAGYAAHSFYDWDWDIPGVTLPAMVFLGVLAGAAARRRPGVRALPAPGFGQGVRVLALVVSTLVMCVVAISGVTPSLAAGRARSAVVTAAKGTASALASAQSSAAFASRLDPLSDAGLLVDADIALQRRQFTTAKADLLEAVGRNPTDRQAWEQLVLVEEYLHNLRAALAISERMLALDPNGFTARQLAAQTAQLLTPARRSATAVRTPSH